MGKGVLALAQGNEATELHSKSSAVCKVLPRLGAKCWSSWCAREGMGACIRSGDCRVYGSRWVTETCWTSSGWSRGSSLSSLVRLIGGNMFSMLCGRTGGWLETGLSSAKSG